MSPSPVLDPSSADTSLAASIKNILASSTDAVNNANAAAAAYYNAYTWPAYCANMESGEQLSPAAQIPPQPPNGYQLSPPDANGYQWPMPSNVPVCAMPPLPFYAFANKPTGPNAPPPAPGTPAVFDIGPQEVDAPGFFGVGADDTEPAGFQKKILGPNGTAITVVKIKIPWGAYYEEVAQ